MVLLIQKITMLVCGFHFFIAALRFSFFAALWSNNLIDTDKAMDSFYTGCAEAGPEGCAFWAPTASEVEANLTKIVNTVRSKPLPMRTQAGYGLLDYAMLRSALFTGLYSPWEAFPVLAEGFAELAAGKVQNSSTE